MKTAIIKTTFWDNDSFDGLHIDSKLIYFYLLANPTRTLHKITKINPKICSAHTGLTVEHVNKGLKQLEEKKLIAFKDNYYVLLNDFVEAKKGRFTQAAIEKEEADIPEEILAYFKCFLEKKISSRTGTVPVHKDKDNNNNKNNNNEQTYFPVEDKAETKSEYCKRKGLPHTPRIQTEAQKEAFKKAVDMQPIIDYFKEQGQQIHGMYFLNGSEKRNKEVKGQIKNVIEMISDHKALIDWWFNTDNTWCNYEPEALFNEKIIERFLNKDKNEKAENLGKKSLLQVEDLKFYTKEEITNAYNNKLILWSEAGNCWKKNYEKTI